ncbi:glycerol kinase GlpK [Longicatena caecimuris]|uniref:Glycerol kinase n=1 Tax=Longicatena caecimuris TaxID=1796635 RepID=A0A4R3TN02_9FIRM|nr:glycerol kinase GlpK [Longicatena caecimuris]MCR1869328.1 glycerol kinase GlpK [Longicatena caecimuris]MCU0101958.1 glycerol kinase GlpK [Longicatena caecimuris]TCU62743.1 glycerol kinase [Longicatena caecimuris]
MQNYIMAIDQGTTSTRAILFDQQSNIIGIAQKELENYYPHPGWVEQNANDIWASTVGVMFEVLAKTGIKDTQIAAIGITNQRETTVVWDKESGQPIYFAIVWQSRQSDSYCEAFKAQGLEEMIKEKTGLLLDPYFSASKIRFILDHVAGAQERAERGELLFGTMDTWLLWKLSQGAKHMSDVSNASRTMLMNLKTLDYDEELLKLWNIPRCMLPEIHDTSEVYSYTSGLFDHPIPIAALVGDQQAALFGQTCFDAGNVKNTYGTGCFLLMNTKEKIIHSQHGLLTCVGWRIKGQTAYVLEGSVFVAGAAIQWLRDGLAIISSSSESESRAKQVNDCDGVYVVPSFTGLGAPYWKPQVKGGILGLTRGTKQEHIIRATIESLAYQTSDVVFAMQEDSGLAIKKMQVDGGASRNDFLLQFQSDILNTQVIRSTISETTALGAAYLAGLAVGVWKHQDDIRKQFQVASIFEPMMEEENRIAHLNGWKRAIHAIMEF